MVTATGQSALKGRTPRLVVPTAEAMEVLGGRLARDCPSGCKIFIQGPLGAGKTTLVRGFLRSLGCTGTVKSPTYTLVEPYFLPGHTVYHFDFYRIYSPKELEFIGLRDYFDGSAVCLVEWPENAGPVLGQGDLHIRITLCDQGRQVVLQALSPVSAAILRNF